MNDTFKSQRFPISQFGQRLASDASIVNLMADLGEALNVNPELAFLGGGNPAIIPEFNRLATAELQALLDEGDSALDKVFGVYQSPKGDEQCIDLLSEYFQGKSWPVKKENLCFTSGSQTAFFSLLNLYSGSFEAGVKKKICLPIAPEYLGYSDQTLAEDSFISLKPKINLEAEHGFYYSVDFDALNELEGAGENIGAICISRPSNPTGGVISSAEIYRLRDFARSRGIPLIVDCAYGEPFPGIEYSSDPLRWDESMIFVFSLSKLGLPGARTGIVLAQDSVVNALSASNTVLCLANGNLGPALLNRFLKKQSLDDICREIILPFYSERRKKILSLVEYHLQGLSYRIHRADGAFFIWLWFDGLNVDSSVLYQVLKTRGVLVMDGSPFFIGLDKTWEHQNQCLRLSYCQSDEVLEKGMRILSEVLRELEVC